MRASTWRSSSPTRSWRWLGPPLSRPLSLRLAIAFTLAALRLLRPSPRDAGAAVGGWRTLEGARHLLHLEALDDVAGLDVLIVLEGHAALVAFLDLADLVLEALQRLEGALVDDDVVAQQPDLGAALDDALRHHAAGDLADLGDVEDLADRGIAEEMLAQRRRQEAAERRLQIVDHVVDDRVVADLDAVAPCKVPRLR